MFGFGKSKNKSKNTGDTLKVFDMSDKLRGFLSSYHYERDVSKGQILEMLGDEHIAAKIDSRLNAGNQYRSALIYPDNGKKIDADMLEWMFNELFVKSDFYKLANFIKYKKPYGKVILYIDWGIDEDAGIPIIKMANADAFSFNKDPKKGKLDDLMYGMDNLSQKAPFQFIALKNDETDVYPDGQSELRQLWFIYNFKKFVAREIQPAYLDHAVILPVAALSEGQVNDDDAINSQRIADLRNGSGVMLRNVKELVVLNQNGQVNLGATIDNCNNAISIKIFGSDLSDAQSHGTYAQAKVGQTYIEGNVKEIINDLQRVKNQVIQWAVWAKFGFYAGKREELAGKKLRAPQYLFDFNEPYELDKFKFCFDSGIPVSFREFSRVFPVPAGWKPKNGDVLDWKDYEKIKEVAKPVNPDQKGNK